MIAHMCGQTGADCFVASHAEIAQLRCVISISTYMAIKSDTYNVMRGLQKLLTHLLLQLTFRLASSLINWNIVRSYEYIEWTNL